MKSIKELEAIREKALEKVNLRIDRKTGTRIVVGMATCGIAAGARPVLQSLVKQVNTRKLADVIVCQTGCIGVCTLEPMVEVYSPGKGKITYVNVTPEIAEKIVNEHIINGNVIDDFTIASNM